MFNYTVISTDGVELRQSNTVKGAELMAAWYVAKGIPCYVKTIGQCAERRPKSRYARLRVELLERR